MSIVPLLKATMVGPVGERDATLARLQDLGVVHLVDMVEREQGIGVPAYKSGALRAFKFLASCRRKRQAVTRSAVFDRDAVVREALAIQERMEELRYRKDFLDQRIREVRIWGDFTFPPLADLAGQRLWFYRMPHFRKARLEGREDLVWDVVGRDNRYLFVVVVAPNEPQDMPVPRSHLGAKSLGTLERELEEIEIELEDLQERRIGLTRWLFLLSQSLAAAEDRTEFEQARRGAYTDDALFGVQGWVGADRRSDIEAFGKEHGLALLLEAPGPEDRPPTLLRNPEFFGGGEEVIRFYSVPGYRAIDPSVPLFVFFALFFAMILSDAGYAGLLALILAVTSGKMRESPSGRRIAAMGWVIAGISIFWGVLAGSYFGVTPPEGHWLDRIAIIDMTQTEAMMGVSVAVGVIHVLVANAMVAWAHRGQPVMLAPIGWMVVVLGACLLGLGAGGMVPVLELPGGIAMVVGALMVVGFSQSDRPWPPGPGARAVRVLLGIGSLTKITQAFGDVLSYLRLFALGLASGSLAVAFNQLAQQSADSIPGVGLLIAGLALVIGHAINFALGIMGGVVHGLRLNVIEFFNWAVSEEGYPFKVFHRREGKAWNPS